MQAWCWLSAQGHISPLITLVYTKGIFPWATGNHLVPFLSGKHQGEGYRVELAPPASPCWDPFLKAVLWGCHLGWVEKIQREDSKPFKSAFLAEEWAQSTAGQPGLLPVTNVDWHSPKDLTMLYNQVGPR